ncbi:MAG: hypothetical protein JWR86_1186, partial [Enterovirga sp.]|nr:hypothetical protein [Enterovirga sp.]
PPLARPRRSEPAQPRPAASIPREAQPQPRPAASMVREAPRRTRGGAPESDPSVVGLGDHVPAFLLRKPKTKLED